MAHRILVVDDDKLSRFVTEQTLEKLGYEVVGVADGMEAVEAVAEGQFEAIVMDCQMPRMDGFEATAQIRRRQAERQRTRTPIIGLSGRAMVGDSEAATARGMDAYLTKPVRAKELRVALERWINGDGEPRST